MKQIKIAHFAAFAPNKTGQYATVKDLIKAERNVGIDAQFVATFIDKKKMAKSTGGKKDGWLETIEPDWALDADILMRHSCIPPKYANAGMPIIMALHGRPESSFMIEYTGTMKCYQLIKNITEDPRYKAWITFWDEHKFQHSFKVPEDKIYYIPAMVDLDEYNPEGPRTGFGRFNGSPNIIVADMWRHDLTPYNMLYAAAKFKKDCAPDAKVQVFGVPIKKAESVLEILRKAGVVGNIIQRSTSMPNVYRAGDILITPHNIATRVVRESLACGLPIVAGSANPYTDFRADPRDIEKFAEQIDRCWQHVRAASDVVKKDCRKTAEKEFNLDLTGKAILACCEDVLRYEKTCFKQKGDVKQKEYLSYNHYLRHQMSKVHGGKFQWHKTYAYIYKKELTERLRKLNLIKRGMSALCLGARDGTEVKAFIDVGLFAVGIDIQPLIKRYVLKGDFQDLLFAPLSVDVVFTNSLDHAYDINGMVKEIKKVLKPNGLFIVDLPSTKAIGNDKWASCRWDTNKDIVKLFEHHGFRRVKTTPITPTFHDVKDKKRIDTGFVEEICFRSPKEHAPIVKTGYEKLLLTRADVINVFIQKNGYKSYLEIGVGKNATYKNVVCDKKVGVDPYYEPDFQMTSDEYFKRYSEKFDVIFIDGLHTAAQAYKDINNALERLTPNGVVLVHDCNPTHELLQKASPIPELAGALGWCMDWKGDNTWTGDTWKALVQFRMNRPDLSCYVIDADYGIGVLCKGKQKVFPEKKTIEELDYAFLEKNRKELLDLRKLRKPKKSWE